MWKKLENFTSSRTDADANQVSNLNGTPDHAHELDDPWLIGQEEGNQDFEDGPRLEEESGIEVVPQPSAASETRGDQSPPVTLGAYTDAVKKFTKSASAFIEQLPLLAEAREAYEEAGRASAELRRVLDAGDENLRALMSHLEQMANIHLVNVPGVKSIAEKRKAEGSKLGPVRAGEDVRGAMKKFP